MSNDCPPECMFFFVLLILFSFFLTIGDNKHIDLFFTTIELRVLFGWVENSDLGRQKHFFMSNLIFRTIFRFAPIERNNKILRQIIIFYLFQINYIFHFKNQYVKFVDFLTIWCSLHFHLQFVRVAFFDDLLPCSVYAIMQHFHLTIL